jgi:hypothetical protein
MSAIGRSADVCSWREDEIGPSAKGGSFAPIVLKNSEAAH